MYYNYFFLTSLFLIIFFSVLVDGTLVLGPLTMDLAGNYTCLAENVFGRDQVVYHLSVMVVPGPPILAVTAVAMNSLTVQWKLTSDGGSPFIGNLCILVLSL